MLHHRDISIKYKSDAVCLSVASMFKFCPISDILKNSFRKCLIVSSNIPNMFALEIVLMHVIMEHETPVMNRLLPFLILMSDCSLGTLRLPSYQFKTFYRSFESRCIRKHLAVQ